MTFFAHGRFKTKKKRKNSEWDGEAGKSNS